MDLEMSSVAKKMKSPGPQYRILSADFIRSEAQMGQGSSDLKQVAIVGRSNVGKSSFLNDFVGQKALARVAKTPGRTQLFNLFSLRVRNEKTAKDGKFCLVDLPGYGFAKVSPQVRKRWAETMAPYLCESDSLKAIVLLIDCRREVEEEEQWVLNLRDDITIYLGLTKVDKLPRDKMRQIISYYKKELSDDVGGVFCLSTIDKSRSEIALLRDNLCCDLKL